MEAIQRSRTVHEERQQDERPSREANKTQQDAAIVRRRAHEARRLEAVLKRNELARQRNRDDELLEAAAPAVLQARKDARAKKMMVKILNEARRVETERKRREK